ncbi:MAG: hypothetical protein OXM55_05185 [Bdellovibrionales bacterium]|nr:hypothetical protein [Bdellovibrionales bacterium]
MTAFILTGLVATTGSLGTLAIQSVKSVNEMKANKKISCTAKYQIQMNEYNQCLKRQKEQQAIGDTEVVNCELPKAEACNVP